MATKKNDSQTSIFKRAVIDAPIAIGGGIGISRLSKSSNYFGQSLVNLPHNPARDTITQFANRYVSKPHSGIFKDWQLDKLAGFSKNTALSHETIRSAWNRAASLVDPTGDLARLSDQRLAMARTPQQAINDIMSMIGQSNSIYMQRAKSLFVRDVSLLNTRAISGLPIETTELQHFSFQTKSRVSLQSLSAKMRGDIERMSSALDASVDIKRLSRNDLAGSQLRIAFKSDRLPATMWLSIPEPLMGNQGVIAHGASQQSQYITGRYGVVENGVLQESFKHDEWMARRAAEDLLPEILSEKKLSRRRLRSLVNQFEQKMIEAPEWIPTITQPHEGLEAYTRVRSAGLRLHDPTGKPLDTFAYSELVEAGGLKLPSGGMQPIFPGASPSQIAHGMASTQDVRNLFFLSPKAASYGRRPIQYLRSGWAPTENALANMNLNPLNTTFAQFAAKEGVSTPLTKAAFVSSKHDPILSAFGVHSEGQLLVSSNLSEQRAVKGWKQFDISASRLMELGNYIEDTGAGSWDINRILKQGTFLGYDPQGSPVVLPEDMNITTAHLFQNDRGKGNFIRVMAEQEIDRMPWSKVFGGAKGMAREVSPVHIGKTLSALGVSLQGGYASPVDAVITMDELKKNRGLHYNQMFTSLWEYSKINMESGKTMSSMASSYVNDPIKVIGKLNRLAETTDKFDHEIMLKNITQIAREASLSPEQFGHVFGAVPDVFGKDYSSMMGALSSAEIAAMEKGVATGITQLFFEGLGGPGAGKTATWEPRMFELLQSAHLGKLSPQLQSEIATRMIATYPEKLLEQDALTTSLASLIKPTTAFGSTPASHILSGLERQNLSLPLGASRVNLSGFGDVYIPSSSTLSQLASYKTPTGKAVMPDLVSTYQDLLEAGAAHEKGELTKEALQKTVARSIGEIGKARSLTVTGTGGLLRNRLPGSVVLTATTGAGEDIYTAGITEPYAKQMIQELKSTRLYQLEELDAMLQKLMSGEKVAGLVARHPAIGPYSIQPINYKLIPGQESRIEFAQKFFNANIQTARGVEELSNPIRLSPLVGLAGDVDGDIVSAMLAGPQLEKSLSRHLASESARNTYEEYAIRAQLLKAKASSQEGAVTLRQAMAGDVVKLAVTEEGRLGRISTALQGSRAAVLGGYGNLSPQQRMQTMGLLEWLEQTPISGKHLPEGQETKIIHLMDDIQEAISKKDAGRIADSVRQVLSQAKIEGQAALRDGFQIRMQDIGSGEVVNRRISGLDIGQTSQHLVDATAAMETSKVGQVSAARARQLYMGKRMPSPAEAESLLRADVAGQSMFSSFLRHTEPGLFTRLSEKVLAASNKLVAAGKSAIPFVKPLALGGAAALGLSAILSEPPKLLDPSAVAAPRADMRSGTGGAKLGTQVHPEHSMDAEPTTSNPVSSQNTARLRGPGKMSHRISINGISPGDVNYNSLSTQLASVTKGNVQSRIQDNRSSLTPQKLSHILENR